MLNGLPSVQPEKRTEERMETHACDLISRQAAIAKLNEIAEMKNAILDSLNISDRRARDMIEAELGQINGDIDSIKNMPSATPEIIRCKDCEWWEKQKDSAQGRCDLMRMNPTGGWYCGNAQRRVTDGGLD